MCKVYLFFLLRALVVALASSSSCNGFDASCDVQDTSVSLLQAQQATLVIDEKVDNKEDEEEEEEIGINEATDETMEGSRSYARNRSDVSRQPVRFNASFLTVGRDYGYGDFMDYEFVDRTKCQNTVHNFGVKNRKSNCRSSCESYATQKGWTDGFCCEYRIYKRNNVCRITREGARDLTPDGNYVAFKYFDNHRYYKVNAPSTIKYFPNCACPTCDNSGKSYENRCCGYRYLGIDAGRFKFGTTQGDFSRVSADECKNLCAWRAYDNRWTGRFYCQRDKHGQCTMSDEGCTRGSIKVGAKFGHLWTFTVI